METRYRRARKAGHLSREMSELVSRYQNRISALETELAAKNDYIGHLEKLTEAHDRLEEYATRELIEADQTIKAQETLQEMMHNERVEAEETIKAQERIQALSVEEKRSAEETIKAHEAIEVLSQQEQLDAQAMINAQQELSNLSLQEIMYKDKVLEKVLEINRDISSILEAGILPGKILASLVQVLDADRGVMYTLTKERQIAPAHFFNLQDEDLHADSFARSREVIGRVFTNRIGEVVLPKKNETHDDGSPVSMLVVPLIHEGEVIGLVYVDIKQPQKLFRKFDLDVAGIFAHQAAIFLNNASLYATIREKNRELLHLVNLKDNFLSRLSEELQAPLAEQLKKLEKGMVELGDTAATKTFQAVSEKLAKLEKTTSRVLNMLSLEREVEDLFREKVDFESLIKEVLARHDDAVREKAVTVSYELDPEFHDYQGNRMLLRTIVDELLSNAVFYNRKGGQVEVKGIRSREYLELCITDTGYGIKSEDQENIFQQFYRTDSSYELNARGAGLGLYMVRTFAEQYKGTVTVKSTLDKGSTFCVTFLLQ